MAGQNFPSTSVFFWFISGRSSLFHLTPLLFLSVFSLSFFRSFSAPVLFVSLWFFLFFWFSISFRFPGVMSSLRLLPCSPSRPSIQGVVQPETRLVGAHALASNFSLFLSHLFSSVPLVFSVFFPGLLLRFFFSGLCFRPPLSRSLSLSLLPLFSCLLFCPPLLFVMAFLWFL